MCPARIAKWDLDGVRCPDTAQHSTCSCIASPHRFWHTSANEHNHLRGPRHVEINVLLARPPTLALLREGHPVDMRRRSFWGLLAASAAGWTVAAAAAASASQGGYGASQLMASPFEDDRPDNCPPW